MMSCGCWFSVKLWRKDGSQSSNLSKIVKAPTVFFGQLAAGESYCGQVAVVPKGTELRKDGSLVDNLGRPSRHGQWSQKSGYYTTADVRPPISNDVRRYMWASFYVNVVKVAEHC
jgi:hypothetical protein